VGYALWLTDSQTDDSSRIRTHLDITFPALLYLFFLLVSVFQAVDPRLSLAQLFMEVQLFLVYFYVINYIKSWGRLRLVLTTLVICLLLESVLMLLQFFFGFEFSAVSIVSRTLESSITSAEARIAGTFTSPNAAATILAASLAITFAAFLTDNRLVDKRLALAALLVGIPALVTTQSRSGWIAFALAVLIILVRALQRNINLRAFLPLLIVALIIGIGFSHQIVERFTADDNNSAQTRIWHVKLAFNILEDHMIAGVGLNNSWLVIKSGRYLPLELMGRRLNVLHNKYLTVWTETGVFGFLVFIWLLLATASRALLSSIHAKSDYKTIIMAGFLAALIAFMYHMLSDPFSARVRVQLLWLILALIAATSRIPESREELKGPAPQTREPTRITVLTPDQGEVV
jgi:O-antigen ligase